MKARGQQSEFRRTLPAAAQPDDSPWARHGFLLALGHEDESLFETLRGPGGAADFFDVRGAKWWRSPGTGDSNGKRGPTRNLTSSQVACVNLLLPLRDHPDLLAAMLRKLDPEIVRVAPLEYETPGGHAISSYVELEWTGRVGTLEGRGSRGDRATSADGCLVGVTANGARRVFLLEFKYTEAYSGAFKGAGDEGERRLRTYRARYEDAESCLSGVAPLGEVLYEPFYQIVRLGLLGDAMRADPELNLDGARVVVVCPAGNTAYRERITSPELAARFPKARTVEAVTQALWKESSGFAMIDPTGLVDAVRLAGGAPLEPWSSYLRRRYGW
jgi:hypothetical protein